LQGEKIDPFIETTLSFAFLHFHFFGYMQILRFDLISWFIIKIPVPYTALADCLGVVLYIGYRIADDHFLIRLSFDIT
jgi:hypothetical protein